MPYVIICIEIIEASPIPSNHLVKNKICEFKINRIRSNTDLMQLFIRKCFVSLLLKFLTKFKADL